MRPNKTKPGKRAELLEIFRLSRFPAHTASAYGKWNEEIGTVALRRRSQHILFLRGFPDLASREPMKAAFYEGELSKREPEDVLMSVLEKHEVVPVEAPEGLIRWWECSENR
jgi:hypothetical protein